MIAMKAGDIDHGQKSSRGQLAAHEYRPTGADWLSRAVSADWQVCRNSHVIAPDQSRPAALCESECLVSFFPEI